MITLDGAFGAIVAAASVWLVLRAERRERGDEAVLAAVELAVKMLSTEVQRIRTAQAMLLDSTAVGGGGSGGDGGSKHQSREIDSVPEISAWTPSRMLAVTLAARTADERWLASMVGFAVQRAAIGQRADFLAPLERVCLSLAKWRPRNKRLLRDVEESVAALPDLNRRGRFETRAELQALASSALAAPASASQPLADTREAFELMESLAESASPGPIGRLRSGAAMVRVRVIRFAQRTRASGASGLAGDDAIRDLSTERRRIWGVAVTATALTLFDAVASWHSIVHLRIAAEGNGLLDMLGSAIGFEAALAVRFVWGAGLTLILAYLAIVQLRQRPERRRPLAYRGLFIVTGVLGVLAVWHAVGLVASAAVSGP